MYRLTPFTLSTETVHYITQGIIRSCPPAFTRTKILTSTVTRHQNTTKWRWCGQRWRGASWAHAWLFFCFLKHEVREREDNEGGISTPPPPTHRPTLLFLLSVAIHPHIPFSALSRSVAQQQQIEWVASSSLGLEIWMWHMRWTTSFRSRLGF